MKFKEGDRVHVLRYDREDVDFYGTLKNVDEFMANLFDCTIKKYEGKAVVLPSDNSFGEYKEDYFVLAEDEENKRTVNDLNVNAYETKLVIKDEEDTEEPVVQRTKNVEKEISYPSNSILSQYNWKMHENAREYIHKVYKDTQVSRRDCNRHQGGETDPVNKPSHYMLGNHEVKDIVSLVADKYHKGSVAHNVASALEYLMRSPDKNGLEDVKKARKCLEFAIDNWEE